jgi:hypothetical protein
MQFVLVILYGAVRGWSSITGFGQQVRSHLKDLYGDKSRAITWIEC